MRTVNGIYPVGAIAGKLFYICGRTLQDGLVGDKYNGDYLLLKVGIAGRRRIVCRRECPISFIVYIDIRAYIFWTPSVFR